MLPQTKKIFIIAIGVLSVYAIHLSYTQPEAISYHLNRVKGIFAYENVTVDVCKNVPLTASKYVRSFTGPDDFYDYVENPTFNCSHPQKFGGVFYGKKSNNIVDGDKWVCLGEELNIKPGNCIVYSFGINNEWSFDDAIAKFGCKVYAFDPSMRLKAHVRRKKIYFFPIGIGLDEIEMKKKWDLKRLSTIMSSLGHNRSDFQIDYLKMDVELAELKFFQEALQENPGLLRKVKQIGMEIHPGKNNELFRRYFNYFMKLEELGFRLTFTGLNYASRTIYKPANRVKQSSCCYELVWVKESNDFIDCLVMD